MGYQYRQIWDSKSFCFSWFPNFLKGEIKQWVASTTPMDLTRPPLPQPSFRMRRVQPLEHIRGGRFQRLGKGRLAEQFLSKRWVA